MKILFLFGILLLVFFSVSFSQLPVDMVAELQFKVEQQEEIIRKLNERIDSLTSASHEKKVSENAAEEFVFDSSKIIAINVIIIALGLIVLFTLPKYLKKNLKGIKSEYNSDENDELKHENTLEEIKTSYGNPYATDLFDKALKEKSLVKKIELLDNILKIEDSKENFKRIAEKNAPEEIGYFSSLNEYASHKDKPLYDHFVDSCNYLWKKMF